MSDYGYEATIALCVGDIEGYRLAISDAQTYNRSPINVMGRPPIFGDAIGVLGTIPDSGNRKYFAGCGNLNLKGCSVNIVDAPDGKPAIRLVSPFSPDLNHATGIGFINTVLGWRATEKAIDIGKVRLGLRFVDFEPHRFKLSLFVQTFVGLKDGFTEVSAWVSPPFLGNYGNEWQEIVFDTEDRGWQQAGNNPEVNTAEWHYVSRPFETAVRHHTGTLALVFADGKWPDIPSGAIDLHWFEIDERS